jgi:hypothetical protein
MKKTITLSLLAALLMSGCSKNQTLTVEGQFGDMASDTILVEYLLPSPRLDTLVADQGKFAYSITPDTTTMFTLVIDEHLRIPVIADGGGHITAERSDKGFLTRSDNTKDANAQLAQLREAFEGLTPAEAKDSAEAFIQRTPDSFINLYLMDEYFTHDAQPDVARMQKIISGMSGVLKDTPYLSALSSKLDAMDKANKTHYLNFVTYKDVKDRRFTVKDIQDYYVCVHFWASWADDNRSAQDSLRVMLKELKQEKFKVVSISLDVNKDEWRRACPKDSTNWVQLCNFKGWNDETVKSMGIDHLPATLLMSPDKYVVGHDLTPAETAKKVRELVAQKKEQEANKKRAEAERLRNLKK